MKLKSLNRYISLIVFLISFLPVYAEEQIDSWSIEKKEESKKIEIKKNDSNSSINSEVFSETKSKNKIQIENEILQDEKDIKLFGIYEPADNNLDLNMWSETSAEKVRSSLSRINKIKLSKSASNFFENTIFSFSYPPKDMSDKEFIDLKINWMVENKRSDLIEKFLNQNNTFHNKGKIIQYLVDENIAKASIKEGCEKISFIDKTIQDSYLEKFKIYCLIFNNKKEEAQLLYDILKEQNLSDKFFDDKINFLFGIKDKVNKEIVDNNLLNFYLSSITIKNFKYEPNKKTKKIIWEYLNAANLIQLDDLQDKEKLKSLEIAANQSQFDKIKIFDIYKKIPFDLNNLINADNIYQSLSGSDARALIYQKFLLSDNNEKKVKLLFLLKDLFKKDNLSNVYIKFMSDRLQEIDLTSIPESYKESVQNNIVNEEIYKLGKIKYDDVTIVEPEVKESNPLEKIPGFIGTEKG